MKNRESLILKNSIFIAIVFLIIGIITIIWFGITKPFNDWSFVADSTLFGQFGDFIGGFVGTIFSLVAVLLLYKTLIAQQDSIKTQEETIDIQKSAFEIELFETTFFNLLKTQHEIIDGIKAYFQSLDSYFITETETVSGREFFGFSKRELKRIWISIENEKYLGKFVNDEEYLMSVQEEIDSYYNPDSDNFSPPRDAKAEGDLIRSKEKIRYLNSFYDITGEDWKTVNSLEVKNKLEAIYGMFFKRYHYAIGHYFRHLYHIIKFAKEFKSSAEQHSDINKKYIEFIQAQMSSFELMLLFYNAISFPKLMQLLIEFNFLENLAEEDLVDSSHNCIEGVKLKSRKELLGF